MPPAGFELTISPSERSQTYALDHAAIGTGILLMWAYGFRFNNMNTAVQCAKYRKLWCIRCYVQIAM